MIRFTGDFYRNGNPVNINLGEQSSCPLIINLEAPITFDSGGRHPEKICLSNDKESVDNIAKNHNAVFNLSNNHIFDFGSVGFSDTKEFLKTSNIRHFGVRSPTEEFGHILHFADDNVCVLAYVHNSCNPVFCAGSYNLVPSSIDQIICDVQHCRNTYGDTVDIILNIHGGLEEVGIPEPERVSLATSCSQIFNVKLIIFHHPHVIQPIYKVNGVVVFFSLGNFVFDGFDYINDFGKKSWGVPFRWNSVGLIVSYNSGKISFAKTHYKNGVVKVGRYRKVGECLFSNVFGLKIYPKLYRIAYRYAMLKNSIARFVARPKIPSFNAIKHILLGKL